MLLYVFLLYFLHLLILESFRLPVKGSISGLPSEKLIQSLTNCSGSGSTVKARINQAVEIALRFVRAIMNLNFYPWRFSQWSSFKSQGHHQIWRLCPTPFPLLKFSVRLSQINHWPNGFEKFFEILCSKCLWNVLPVMQVIIY